MNKISSLFAQTEHLQPALHVLEQSVGYLYQAALRAAVKLHIAEALQSGPKTAEQLAKETGATPRELTRLLRLLATKDIFKLTPDNKFDLTPAAQYLSEESAFSLRQAVLMFTDPSFWLPAGELHRSAFESHLFNRIFGMSFYEYWDERITDSDNFHEGISSVSQLENAFVVKNYSFPDNALVADIGGGCGGLLLDVMKKNLTLKGILFDKALVLEKHILEQLDNPTRWRIQAGSFLETCPEADIYLLKYITHNWSDAVAIKILNTIRKSMKSDSTLLIIENVVTNDNLPHFSKNMDLVQMALFDEGHERTASEFSLLLNQANLQLTQIISTQCHISIIEARPI
ncbi:methyltransferase [Providencia huaxiensis]|uniref:methyltransferase n=1 Tax=Providencia huaxiensis TaxID=2027290 RepID=UPI0034E5DDC8